LVGRKYLDEPYAVHTVFGTELETPNFFVAVRFNYEQKSQTPSSSFV